MFKTLRSKLIFSYAAVVGLFLLLAVGGTVVVAATYGQRSAFDDLRQKGALIFPLLQVEVNNSARPAAQPLLARLRDGIQRSGVRVLLVNADTMVVVDDSSTAFHAVGQTFKMPSGSIAQASLYSQKGFEGTFRYAAEKVMFDYVARGIRVPAAGRLRNGLSDITGSGTSGAGQPTAYIVVLAQPQRDVRALVASLTGYLGPVALVALLLSLVTGFLLARSISRPIARLAEGAASMASGDYGTRISVEGRDELAALTERFNEMALEVGRAHQMQRDFVANISHDLKTPLTSIQGFSQAMLDGAITEPEGYARAAEVINSEAERMGRLVNDLLDLSRLQNSLDTLQLAPTDLAELLGQVVTAMQPQAAKAGVELKFDPPGAPAPTLADQDRLKQAFSNLIDNAIKFTPEGRGVRVSLDPGTHLQVTVADNGPGIPAEDLPRVMERFYQVDKSRQAQGGRSAGLGLAIAREIVRAHHGEISIDSAPLRGAAVRVVLPLVPVTRPAPARNGLIKRLGSSPRTAPLTGPLQQAGCDAPTKCD